MRASPACTQPAQHALVLQVRQASKLAQSEAYLFSKNFLLLLFSPYCSVDDVLGQSLDEVIRQGLLDPLVPYLTSTASAATSSGGGNGVGGVAVTNANSNSVTSGGGGGGSGGLSNIAASTLSGGQRSAASVVVSGCSAAESSSKEEEGDLSR